MIKQIKKFFQARPYRMVVSVIWVLVTYNWEVHDTIKLPKELVPTILTLYDDHSGHNGFAHTYAAFRWAYHWWGMKREVGKHCQACHVCKQFNVVPAKYTKGLHYQVPTAQI